MVPRHEQWFERTLERRVRSLDGCGKAESRAERGEAVAMPAAESMRPTSLAFPTAPQPPARIIVDRPSLARSARTNPHYPETTELGSLAMDNMSDNAIRPFRIDVTEEALVDLRRRIAATRWPEKETVADQSQGVQLATMQKLADYWATDYDWRKVEARLQALPQFIAEIDGLDIHFIHVRSKHDNALPLIVTHGWPGSVIEQLKIIDPLTNPTAHGANASDAFHVVIPSMAGYGFSG